MKPILACPYNDGNNPVEKDEFAVLRRGRDCKSEGPGDVRE